MNTKLMKWQDAAKALGAGKTERIVICRQTGCSSCNTAETQLFSTPAWKAKGIPLVNASGLPTGVQGSYFTPGIADVEIYATASGALRMRCMAGTVVKTFKKVGNQYLLAQFLATITGK